MDEFVQGSPSRAVGPQLYGLRSGDHAVAPGIADRAPLSAAEREVVRLARTGGSVREIAEELCLSESTVHTHLTHIYRKLGVRGRLALLALRETEDVTPPASDDVAPPTASRDRSRRNLAAGSAAALLAIGLALLQPVTALASAPALLAAAILTRRGSGHLRGSAAPLVAGSLVCVAFAIGALLMASSV